MERDAGRFSNMSSSTVPYPYRRPVYRARTTRRRTYSAAPANALRPHAGSVFRRICVIVLLIALLIAAFFLTRGFNLYRDALADTSLDEMAASIESKPAFVSADSLPTLYLRSVVVVEDQRFYTHPGVDPIACARALLHDISARDIVEGGSTITQQLAKNQYFTQEQTLERKIAEMFMAVTLEQHFSKQEILELYVNSIYFGDGRYGVESASRGYFGKDANMMNPYESTMLAGVPNAPSAYAPSKNVEFARQRQQQVIDKLVSYDYLSQAEARTISDMQDS